MTAETLIMPKTVADLTETVVKLLSRVSSRPCEESTENCIENSVSPGQESPEASENDSVVEANVDENDDWEILSAEQEGMPPTDQDKLDAPAEDVIEKNHGPSVEKTNATDKNEPPTAAKGHMTRLYSSVVSDREVSKQPAQTLKQSRRLDSGEWVVQDAIGNIQQTDEPVEDISCDAEGRFGDISSIFGLSSSLVSTNKTFCRGKQSLNLLEANDTKDRGGPKSSRKPQLVIHSSLPEIGSKSVLPKDLFHAAPQHNNIGFELKPIHKDAPKLCCLEQ